MRATRMALLGTSALAIACLSHTAAFPQTAAPAPPAPQAAPRCRTAGFRTAPGSRASPGGASSGTDRAAPATAAGPPAASNAPTEIDMPQVTVEGRQPKPARRAARSEPGRPSTTVAAPLPNPCAGDRAGVAFQSALRAAVDDREQSDPDRQQQRRIWQPVHQHARRDLRGPGHGIVAARSARLDGCKGPHPGERRRRGRRV